MSHMTARDRGHRGGPAVPLGRVGGVPVGAEWSALVLVVLLAQVLAAVVLPDVAPERSPLAYWLVGVACAALLLGSLLAHEVAHAVVARRWGVPVRSVTLWLLGGVARLEGEAPTARLALSGVTVADVMTRDPVCLPSWVTVTAAASRLEPRQVHAAYPVLDLDGEPLGTVTWSALVAVPADARAWTRVGGLHVPVG